MESRGWKFVEIRDNSTVGFRKNVLRCLWALWLPHRGHSIIVSTTVGTIFILPFPHFTLCTTDYFTLSFFKSLVILTLAIAYETWLFYEFTHYCYYRTYFGSFFAVQAIANLLSISLTKQRLILVVAFSRVLSKFLTKLLHLSIQELVLSMTHLALTGTKPLCPCFFFSTFEGLGESLNRILVIIAG